jgi:hypothetical protein
MLLMDKSTMKVRGFHAHMSQLVKPEKGADQPRSQLKIFSSRMAPARLGAKMGKNRRRKPKFKFKSFTSHQHYAKCLLCQGQHRRLCLKAF